MGFEAEIETSIGKMTAFAFAHMHAETWGPLARGLVDDLDPLPPPADGEAQLGFLYATDALADDFASILTYLRQTLGVEHWVGSLGIGICGGDREYFDQPAAAVMVASLPEAAFRGLPVIEDSMDQIPEAERSWMTETSPPFGVVHGDPMNPDIPSLVESLSLEIENLTLEVPGFLVGGLTSSRSHQHQLAETITSGGLSGVLFGPQVEVATGLSQGCSPVGGAHNVSECMDNVIMGLDGDPALDVFREDVGELLARDLNRAAGYIHAAFPIRGSDTGDYLVRNLVGIDPERGWLAIGGPVEAGDRVMFVRRDPKAAETDLIRMAEDLKRRLPGPPRGGLYFSCVARGPNMFGEDGQEMALIKSVLGEFPVVGFFGNGEISNNRLYGFTGVLTLFL